MRPPPTQVMSTMNSRSSRSVPAGTPSSALLTVKLPTSRTLTHSVRAVPSLVIVTVCGFGEVSVHPSGTISVTVHTVPAGKTGSSVKVIAPIPEVPLSWSTSSVKTSEKPLVQVRS